MNGLKLPPTVEMVGVHVVPSQLAIPAHGWPAMTAGVFTTPPATYSRPFHTAIAQIDPRVLPVQPVPIAAQLVPFHIARLAVWATPPALSKNPPATSRS